jgi:hypothetical protein
MRYLLTTTQATLLAALAEAALARKAARSRTIIWAVELVYAGHESVAVWYHHD